MATEYELKFRATPQQLAAIAESYTGFTRIDMITTYYDTPDRALAARRWTLRHRQENQIQVCTLKTPAGAANTRGEWETQCDDIQAAIPRLSQMSGSGELEELAGRGIVPTCGARFTRRALALDLGESQVELALDEGYLVGGEKELPFAEVEVELKSGSKADAAAFAALLAGKHGLTPEKRSKHLRAMALGQEGSHGL